MSWDFADACKVFFARNIESDGIAYYAIYGKHINGGFIAFPGEGKSAEQSLNGDRGYNIDRLTAAGFDEKTAADIADFCADWIARNHPDTSGVNIAEYFGLKNRQVTDGGNE